MKARYNPLESVSVADPPPAATEKRPSKPRRMARDTATRRPRPVSAEAAAALERATTQASLANYPAIISGFIAKGIPESEIKPRENVFTFKAWRALGRIVRKGEHGVKIGTVIPIGNAEETVDPETGEIIAQAPPTRPWTTTVFHISQTDPISTPTPTPAPTRNRNRNRNPTEPTPTPPTSTAACLPPVQFDPSSPFPSSPTPVPRPAWRQRYAQRAATNSSFFMGIPSPTSLATSAGPHTARHLPP